MRKALGPGDSVARALPALLMALSPPAPHLSLLASSEDSGAPSACCALVHPRGLGSGLGEGLGCGAGGDSRRPVAWGLGLGRRRVQVRPRGCVVVGNVTEARVKWRDRAEVLACENGAQSLQMREKTSEEMGWWVWPFGAEPRDLLKRLRRKRR